MIDSVFIALNRSNKRIIYAIRCIETMIVASSMERTYEGTLE